MNTTSPIEFKKSHLAVAVILLLTFAVYFQTTYYDFLMFDDVQYITTNKHVQNGLTLETTKWAFTTTHHASWQPIVWLSFQADIELFGLNPSGFHLTNLIIHILSSLLLYIILIKAAMDPWKSVFVVSIFALHPLHVESVAWIAERKDVLSAFFWFLTMYLYISFTKNKTLLKYSLVFIALSIGLMSKPTLVTLPLVLILFDFWPLKRFELNLGNFLKSAKEKIPLFLLTIISSVITIYAQNSGEAVVSSEQLPLLYRLANAFSSYMDYILATLFPINLAVLYPHPQQGISTIKASVSFLVIILITGFTIYRHLFNDKKEKYLIFGWFWFLGILAPTIGIIQVGSQSHADRYMYIPIIGLAIIIAWGVEELLGFYFSEKKIKKIAALLIISTVMLMASVTYKQTSYWENDETLFRRAVDVTKNNHVAHNNLGKALLDSDKIEQSIGHFKTALEIHPEFIYSLVNIGLSYKILGQQDLALGYFNKSISIEPSSAAYNNIGLIYMEQKEPDSAIEAFEKALNLDSNFSDAYYHLGNIYLDKHLYNKAILYFKKYISLRPLNLEGYFKLAFIYKITGELKTSLLLLNKILEIEPGNKTAINNIKFLNNTLKHKPQ